MFVQDGGINDSSLDTNVSILQLAGHTKCTYCLLPKELHPLMMEQDFSNQEKVQFTWTLMKDINDKMLIDINLMTNC